jgi:putative tryptophan/tyrosine transport system substrate-binding protein
MIARRKFIAGLGATAGSSMIWPLAGTAQQSGRVRRIAVLAGGTDDDPILRSFIDAFSEELQRAGWLNGRDLRIDVHFAPADAQQMCMSVNEVLAINPDAIVSNNTPVVRELQRRTQTVPIVFVTLADPVDTGIVRSLPHPGGNTTGYMNPETSMSGKWLEILKDTVPSLNHVLVMVNAGNEGNAARLRVIEALAPSVGVRVSSYAIREEADIESAIKVVAGQPNVGIIAAPASPINELRKSIFALAERHRLPAVYAYRYYAVDGGLMSYGAEPIRMWRQTATYVDRILRGAKPADLPVQGPATFQLVLNLKAARAISLTIPDRVRALADEVIE